MKTFTYVEGSALDDVSLWIHAGDGSLLNLSSGYTFSLTVLDGRRTAASGFTKTIDITGAVGTGSEPAPDGTSRGTPNLVIAWDAATDLTTLTQDTYTAVLTMLRTADSKPDIRKFELVIIDADT